MSEVQKETDKIKAIATLDVEGYTCPLPLLKIKKKLAKLSLGDILQVNGMHTSVILDIKDWCERGGHFFLGEKDVPINEYCYIKKG